MKPTNVLMLDLHPTGELGHALRVVLEANTHSPVTLQQETLAQHLAHDDRAAGHLAALIARLRPAVIFVVSPWSLLQQVKALFPSLRRAPPAPPLVVVSDAGAPEEIFEFIKLGVEDFITPPFTPTGVLPRLWRLLERTGESFAQRLREKFLSQPPLLIGQSPAFRELTRKIPLIAPCAATVLISGETGTGKEVCARAIHQASPRAARPFVAVNCGAIPIELVENELFGHERGAYTHAAAAQEGQIQAAEGGTLFLDEIDSLPLLAQVKLLRFLQEKEFKPLGSTRTRRADVRVITATNVNVEQAVREGKLRQDLYYRLNILPLVLPPLRERREDIPLLAAHFLTRYAAEFQKPVADFAPDALHKLLLHDWPGNVRELEHVVARAVAMAEWSVIGGGDIVLPSGPDALPQESFQQMKARLVGDFERTYLQGLLIAHQGNITKAAEAAQKNRRAFFELIRKYGIDANNFRKGGG